MSSDYTSLCDLGPVALSHRTQVEEVKSQIGVTHGYFDAWIYGFLENKKFDINETVSKLRRRFDMEVNVLGAYELSDYMRQSLRQGIIQEIGEDKQGRVTFYIYTKRDFPKAEHRDDNRMSFDMFVSYGTRLRQSTKRSQIALLINQSGSSFFKNIDIGFQGDAALRISKFYPGMVDKVYVCKMASTLSYMAKPVFSRLPAVVSDRIEIINESDIKKGTLLEYFDQSVLPLELGGTNDCDHPEQWNAYADRVEEYFRKMKSGINERGLTVKEWELEELGIDPSSGKEKQRSPVSFENSSVKNSLKNSLSSIPEGPMPLVSCRSNYGDMDPGKDSVEDNPSVSEWKRIFRDLPPSLSLFFVEEYLRWRKGTEDDEEADRYRIMHANGVALSSLSEEKGVNLGVDQLYKHSLFPIVALAKFWIVVITILSSVYFVTALVFWAVFSADLIVTLFLGFFLHPSFYFPLSCAIVVVFVQGAGFCTRALDIVYAIWSGRVIPPLERFGPTGGAIGEVIIFIFITVVQVVAFFAFAAKDGAAVGLQYAFATAWLVAVCIIFITHALFFSGFLNKRDDMGRDHRIVKLPFFLTQSDSTIDEKLVIRSTTIVVSGVLLGTSLLLGVGFLISRILALYVCTVVCTIFTAYIVNFFCDELTNSLSGLLMSVAIWVFCFTWLFVTFAFGFRNQTSEWMWPVLFSCVISGSLIFCAFICLKQNKNSTFLRLLYIFVLVYFTACWICAFPLVNWKLGVFIIALTVHNFLNIVLAPCRFVDCRASFIVALATMLLLISCVFLGWDGTSLQWQTEDSFTVRKAASEMTLSSLQLYHQYPVCALRIGELGPLGSSFFISDTSYLLEVGAAILFPSVIQEGLDAWFTEMNVVYDGVVYREDENSWYIQQFSSLNTVFLVCQQFSPFTGILSMVIWIDSMAIRPLGILLPRTWNYPVNYVMSFLSQIIPFDAWERIHKFKDILQQKEYDGNKVIICASGTAGGAAAAAASSVESEAEVQAIIYNSAGLRNLANYAKVDDDQYHAKVLSISAVDSAEGFYGGVDVTMAQQIWCGDDPETCMSQSFMTRTLQDACELHQAVHVD